MPLVGAVFALATTTRPAAGQATSTSRSISLAGQTPWVAPGGDALLRLKIRGDVSGLEVAATIHRAVATRSQLLDTIAGRRLGAVEGLVSDSVQNLPTDADGDRVLTIGLQNPAEPRNPARVALGRGASAIYPVNVELRRADGDQAVDHFVTHLAVLAPSVEPLTVAMVWRLDATPAHRPGGALHPTARRDLSPGGRIARIVDALTAYSDVPATVAPTAETLEGWLDTAEDPGDVLSVPALAQLRTLAGSANRQFVTGPYIPVDLPSLEAGALSDEIGAQFARGEDVMRAILDLRPDPRTVVAGTVDAASLNRLREVGTDRVVIDPASVAATTRLTQARPFPVTARGRTFKAAVADPGLRELLASDHDEPALRAQQFITGLLLVALEAPSDPRGVVVETPEHLDAPPAMLTAVLDALRATPALRPDTLDGMFVRVTAETRARTISVSPRGVSTDHLAVDAAAVRNGRHAIDAFTRLVGDDDPVAGAAERDLLLSQQRAISAADRRRARRYLSGVAATIGEVLGRVHVPAGRTVTLTARRASIPISLLNDNPRPLQVRVRLTSDKLLFPKGAERVLTLAPRNTTERFAVETRTSGAFPLTITVTSPDGQLAVTETQFSVRSTAVSGVGIFIAAGAGAFLFGWWGTHLRRRGAQRVLASPEPAGLVAHDAPQDSSAGAALE